MKFIKITLIIILLLSIINFTYSATDNVDEIWGNEPTGNVDSDFEPNGDNNGRGPVGGGPPGGGGPPDTPVSPWPILLIGTVYIWYLNHNKQTKLFTTNK